MARVLAVVPDLLLGSKVEEMLKATGHEVDRVSSLPESTEADVLIVDLEAVDAARVVALGVPVLGFYSHVDVETKRRAESEGVTMAVPRSRMARELPDLIERLRDD